MSIFVLIALLTFTIPVAGCITAYLIFRKWENKNKKKGEL